MMKTSFVCGIVTGTIVGMGVACYALQELRPDVTAKMMRDGKRVLKRYRRMMSN